MTTPRTAAQQLLKACEQRLPLQGQAAIIDELNNLRAALAEPVQEPVAWIHTDPDKRRVKFLEWRENEPGYRGDWIKTPLYTAPPQRKPLSEDEALDIARTFGAQPWPPGSCVAFARAIERAHGIGGAA